MEFNELKQCFMRSPELSALDDASRAFLLSRGEEVSLEPGAVVYAQGAKLDDTFCVLLRGEVWVEKKGTLVGTIPPNQVFGEMAYFTPEHSRTATVRAGDDGATVLKVALTAADLHGGRFEGLKEYLGRQAWVRFVSDSQR